MQELLSLLNMWSLRKDGDTECLCLDQGLHVHWRRLLKTRGYLSHPFGMPCSNDYRQRILQRWKKSPKYLLEFKPALTISISFIPSTSHKIPLHFETRRGDAGLLNAVFLELAFTMFHLRHSLHQRRIRILSF